MDILNSTGNKMNYIHELSNSNINDEEKDLGGLTVSTEIADEEGNSFEEKCKEPENGQYYCFEIGYTNLFFIAKY
jgi:hypothetical protein